MSNQIFCLVPFISLNAFWALTNFQLVWFHWIPENVSKFTLSSIFIQLLYTIIGQHDSSILKKKLQSTPHSIKVFNRVHTHFIFKIPRHKLKLFNLILLHFILIYIFVVRIFFFRFRQFKTIFPYKVNKFR